MKVIVAGFPKTGTKSMRVALTELGYNVYDVMENFDYLREDWEKIISEGGTTEDFRRMLDNVDAVTDIPGAYFWDEIHKAFPDSKIILTMRENEEEWSKSLENQIKIFAQERIHFFLFLAPTAYKLVNFTDQIWRTAFGSNVNYRFLKEPKYSMTLYRMAYRRHNSHVLQTAPKDKLLVYNVKEGWEPLCKFLNVDIPDKPFPHRNVKGDLFGELADSPSVVRSMKEIVVTRCLIFVALGFGVYKLTKGNYVSRLWK